MVSDLVDFARECLGTPFKHQGRVNGRGLDCAGVLVHVMRRAGVPVIDSIGYPRMPVDNQITKILDAEPALERLTDKNYQPGDVLLMRFRHEPQHVAIFAGENIVHSYSAIGKVVEHRLSDVWRRRIVRGYRIVR